MTISQYDICQLIQVNFCFLKHKMQFRDNLEKIMYNDFLYYIAPKLKHAFFRPAGAVSRETDKTY